MIKKETIIRDTGHKHDLFEEGKEVTYKLEETIVEPANFRSIKYMEGCI